MPTRHSLFVVVLAMLLLSSAGGSIFVSTAIAQSTCPPSAGPFPDVSVVATGAAYIAASGSPTGSFTSGQNADIMLSGIDFNNTGGSLQFNHQGGIATDGTRLFLADSFNHRVLIWSTLPTANVAPDLVLGQPDFTSNTPGSGRGQMNMPMQVSTDGRRLAVADSYNDRILIWTSFPTRNGAPADLVINGSNVGTKGRFSWPWGVWTNGLKLVVTGTGSANVVIWNTFPTSDDVPPDIALTGGGKLGTPRMITSNGSSLIVGDHNARVPGKFESGSFFWKTFPTADEAPFDFYMEAQSNGGWFGGTLTSDGRLLAVGTTLYIWNSFPTDEQDAPDLAISGYNFQPGDGKGVAVGGGRVYVSAANLNKIVVYNSIPTRADQVPDFAVGSPDVCTNTLHTIYFVTNPVAASNGTSLFASSDYDRKFFVWRKLPGQSGAHPDFEYRLPHGVWAVGINGRALAIAGGRSVYVWDDFPVNGELPSRTFSDGIGSVRFSNLMGVALDDRYFYVADADANKVYVWSGIPLAFSEPAFTLAVTQPQRMSSDGTYLIVTATSEHKVLVYPVAGLSSTATPVVVGGPGQFNLPKGAFAAQGRLFVADTGFNRVQVWSNIQNALAGQPADVVLGENNFSDTAPEIGRNKTFWPASVFYDGKYLWIGEYKFSHRLLRFSPNATAGTAPGAPADLAASSSGSSVTLSWRAPTSGDSPTAYMIEAGAVSGSANLANFSTGNTVTSYATTGVPDGTYYVRVRSAGSAGIGPPSDEAALVVPGTACTASPGAPSGFTSNVAGSTVTLAWSAGTGAATSYVIEAGSASGLANLANFDTGSTVTGLVVTRVGAGTYFVRVRGKNACGGSPPSNESVVAVR